MTRTPHFGVLLPHFGQEVRRGNLLDHAVKLEEHGFDSVWVRDHVLFQPHAHEGSSRAYLDPFVTLAAVAAVTHRITLAFGTLTPHRHPIQSAVLLASLEHLAGPGRVLAGWGVGSTQSEFDAIGLGGVDRRRSVEQQLEVLRTIWRQQPASFHSEYYSFDEIVIDPSPPPGRIPLWYGGPSAAAVRRAVQYCDGWIPPRMPRRDFANRMGRMRRLAAAAGRDTPSAGILLTVVPASTRAEANRYVDVAQMGHEMERMKYARPAHGEFSSIEDFDGAVIAGPPDTIVEEVSRYIDLGAEELVFDFRLRPGAWRDCVDVVASEVVPQLTLHAGRDSAASTHTADRHDGGRVVSEARHGR